MLPSVTAMKNESLHESLEELRAEIHRTQPEGVARERLDALVADIERRLDEPDNAEHHASLIDQLKDSIDEFKLEHPQATSILNRIMVSLAGAGI